MKRFFTAMVVAVAMTAVGAKARPVLDCPLRDVPYSTNLPLIDILGSPDAKTVVDIEAPGLLKGLPSPMFGPVAPSFSAIISLRGLAAFKGKQPDSLAFLDAPLAAVPLTSLGRKARCARYDDERPKVSLPSGRPRILLFEKINGFRDAPSVDAAHTALLSMAKARSWAILATDKGGAMNPATLSKFDLVIWNNISGDVLTLKQRAAFKKYIENGGGFIGLHGSAGDPITFWDWYVDTLIGARFAGHPIAKHFQNARVVIEDASSPLTRGLPPEWMMKDEWYSFTNNPRDSGSTILATLDEKTYDPAGMRGQNLRMGDHPIVWTRCVGRGRVFYSAIGHLPETYFDTRYETLLRNAVDWTLNARQQGCSAAGKM